MDGVKIAAWGLSFKANTDDRRDSPSIEVLRRLVAAGDLGHVAAMAVDFWKLYDENYRYFFLAEPLLSDMAIHEPQAFAQLVDKSKAALAYLKDTTPNAFESAVA